MDRADKVYSEDEAFQKSESSAGASGDSGRSAPWDAGFQPAVISPEDAGRMPAPQSVGEIQLEWTAPNSLSNRREFLGQLGSGLIAAGFSGALLSTLTGCQTPHGPRVLPTAPELTRPPLGRDPFGLMDVAAAHVKIAEDSRGEAGIGSAPLAESGGQRLWGRLGGSRAEGASAGLLHEQLRPWVNGIDQEGFAFDAHRVDQWRMLISGETPVASAVPAPMGARFPDGETNAPLHRIDGESDWELARGRWVFLPAAPDTSLRRNAAHDTEVYIRAVKAGAAGVVFALPTPGGETWRSVVHANPNAPDVLAEFKTDFYPIPCFSVDAADGARLGEAAARAADLNVSQIQEPLSRRNGANVVGALRAQRPGASTSSAAPGLSAFTGRRGGAGTIAFFANLDSTFTGATENASGLATLVGLAQQLATGPAYARRSDVYFVGLSAQHDGAAGLRAFAEADPGRMAEIRQFYFLQRTSARNGGHERVAFMGDRTWSEVAAAVPAIFREAGLEGEAPQVAQSAAVMDAVVGDRRRARTFCLQQTPPWAFTDHDTLEKLDPAELERSVDFHLRVIETAGALVPGTYREALRTPERVNSV